MGKLNEIRDKLLAGSTTKQLVKQGYAKSSVFRVAKKIKNPQPAIATLPVPDEIQELRHRREVIKLQKEIAELEFAKEKVPDRLTKLEAEVDQLNQQLPDLVESCYSCLYVAILLKHGWNEEEALQEAKNGAHDFLKLWGY